MPSPQPPAPALPSYLSPVKLLGTGTFASVWCCEDRRGDPDAEDDVSVPRFVAVKVGNKSKSSSESMEIESEAYEYIQHMRGSSRVPLARCLGWSSVNDDGMSIPCLILKKYDIDVFQFMQMHVHYPKDSIYNKLFACRRRREQGDITYKRSRNSILCGRPIPLNIVKKITKALLSALEFLHDTCGLAHTDIKPDNLFFKGKALPEFVTERKKGRKEDKDKEEDKDKKDLDDSLLVNENSYSNNTNSMSLSIGLLSSEDGAHEHEWDCVLSDFGNVIRRFTEKREENKNYEDIPDEIEYIYERNMFQAKHYRAPECLLGIPRRQEMGEDSIYSDASKMDIWSVGCLVYEMITGKYLFNPRKSSSSSPVIPGTSASKREHIRQIIEITGCNNWTCFKDSPKYSTMFTEVNGKTRLKISGLIEIRNLDMCMQDDGVKDPMLRKQLCDFIAPMLAVNPKDRTSAHDMLKHQFLLPVDYGEK